jgi:hypothetical protein
MTDLLPAALILLCWVWLMLRVLIEGYEWVKSL